MPFQFLTAMGYLQQETGNAKCSSLTQSLLSLQGGPTLESRNKSLIAIELDFIDLIGVRHSSFGASWLGHMDAIPNVVAGAGLVWEVPQCCSILPFLSCVLNRLRLMFVGGGATCHWIRGAEDLWCEAEAFFDREFDPGAWHMGQDLVLAICGLILTDQYTGWQFG